MARAIKSAFLKTLNHTLNPLTLRAARSGRGPFSLVRHVGRKSGRLYETPLILAIVADGFVAELTYGPEVSWFRNVTASGSCEVVVKGVSHRVINIEPMNPDDGRKAFPIPARWILRLTRRRDFRLLRTRTAG